MGFKDSAKLVTLTQQQLEQLVESVASATAAKLIAGSTLTVGPLVVDLGAHEVRLDGELVVMQPQQFRALVALAKHVGQVLSRDQLTEMAYDDPGSPDVRSVDVAILRLRRAFGAHAGMLRTVVRAGYKLVPESTGATTRR